MQELKDIRALKEPDEVFLVVDAMTGQDAVNVAESFNEAIGITGVVLTKLDGDTRGGAALSIRSVTQNQLNLLGWAKNGCARAIPSRAYGFSYFRYGRCSVTYRESTGKCR